MKDLARSLKWVVPSVLAVLLGLWIWRTFFPGDEAMIRRVILRAAEVSSFTPDAGPLGQLTQAAELGSLCTGDIKVRVDVLGGLQGALDGRDQVRAAATQAASVLGQFRIKIVDTLIREIDEDRARANVTVSLEGGGTRDFNAQEFSIQLRRVDRHWLLSGVESVRTLQR